MRISSLIIGILVIGVFMTGFYEITKDMASSDGGYNVAVDDSYSKNFDKADNVSESIKDDWQKIQNFTTNEGSTIGIITLVPDFLGLAKNTIFLPLNLMEGFILNTRAILHLPEWTITAFIAIFSAIIMFAMGALILRYRYV